MKYQPVIGLEIHAELKTKTKMFCNSLNDPLEQHPNVNICPVCAGQPGALPVINKEAVRKVLMVGLALDGKIAETSYFDRKNYFYPDLPKGYQISQYKCPLVEGGRLNKVRITRIHLEEDTGKLVHREGENYSLIDFNRAGVPLMELVTEPAIASSGEARAFAEELQLLLKYLGVSDADMEKGQMRVEVNISLQSEISDSKLGTKVEVKNLNSFRSVERAIEYEIKRQTGVLEEGKKVIQETRGWDEKKQKTFSQRQKEESHDYRYFPEPDLPSLKLEEIEEFKIENLKRQLPELPWQKRERLAKQYGLKDNLDIFIRDKALADYFENIISEILAWEANEQKEKLIKLASNYLLSDLQGILKEKSASFDDILITPENFAELMKMIAKNEISSRVAKDVLKVMFQKGGDPSEIIKNLGVSQISDKEELERIAKKIIEANPDAVLSYKQGRQNALQFLSGQIMKETRGKANPKIIQEILIKSI
ncbi:MAG: glutaminyl-tRNA synthase (glutamine-hydrolyzing) subunit B [Candidatus Tagabacteria bacterium RIFCSPLOWO2_01_FULL_39_11]|uniref:Aspartyl/glutamyl-tRNA(Asn/Gln) amidotransferase subunit B n=1 Tax=Candidatus Tagabacteria bacterium RIFCSPLOWO2_01_FULL_39_11 TaxID=1802295 RepID=A0A1G2LNC4_9BACT|nr:MAG: glutaminyl-tRNA synthase (glutamine-hydrolyzing) subunit B [Candidatus Tagabacteria bacterium RIFCSPLOWO2_01_FULL_39_11]